MLDIAWGSDAAQNASSVWTTHQAMFVFHASKTHSICAPSEQLNMFAFAFHFSLAADPQ